MSKITGWLLILLFGSLFTIATWSMVTRDNEKTVCGKVVITGLTDSATPIVYYECRTRFSNGTFIRLEGDSPPCKNKICS